MATNVTSIPYRIVFFYIFLGFTLISSFTYWFKKLVLIHTLHTFRRSNHSFTLIGGCAGDPRFALRIIKRRLHYIPQTIGTPNKIVHPAYQKICPSKWSCWEIRKCKVCDPHPPHSPTHCTGTQHASQAETHG